MSVMSLLSHASPFARCQEGGFASARLAPRGMTIVRIIRRRCVIDVEIGTRLRAMTSRTFLMCVGAYASMRLGMRNGVDQFKVIQTVVKLIAILVVNNLGRQERATKGFFHNEAMLPVSPPIDLNDAISVLYRTNTIWCACKNIWRAVGAYAGVVTEAVPCFVSGTPASFKCT